MSMSRSLRSVYSECYTFFFKQRSTETRHHCQNISIESLSILLYNFIDEQRASRKQQNDAHAAAIYCNFNKSNRSEKLGQWHKAKSNHKIIKSDILTKCQVQKSFFQFIPYPKDKIIYDVTISAAFDVRGGLQKGYF